MPPFSTSRHTASKLIKAAPDDEVVEDSEPEREEQRRVEKERRREKRMRKKPPEALEVIEVSDDSLDAIPLPAQTKCPRNVEPRSVIIISGSLHLSKKYRHSQRLTSADDSDSSLLIRRRAHDVTKAPATPQDLDLPETYSMGKRCL